MSNSSTKKQILSFLSDAFSSLSPPISFIYGCYDIYYSASMIKEGKVVELGCEKTGNAIGKRVGNVVGGFIGTIIAPGVGSAVGCSLGWMVGSYLGGKGLKSLGENISN